MQMPIKHLLERNAFSIAITLTLIIAFLSLISISGLNLGLNLRNVNNPDKIGHFIAYFVLSLSWFYALNFDSRPLKEKLIIISVIILYGIILEAIQEEMTTHRTGDIYDILANSSGVLMATLIFSKLNYWFNSMLK